MVLVEEKMNVLPEEIFENKELASLIRSVKKEGFIMLIQVKYGETVEKSVTFNQMSAYVDGHSRRQEIFTDLVEISDCIKEVDHESFTDLCNSYEVMLGDFHEEIHITAVRCYIQTELDLFHRMKIVASVNKEKQFEVLGGKDIVIPVVFEDRHKTEITQALDGLIETGRKYVINVDKVKDDIIMTAHFENRKKTFTTISKGNSISTVTVIPASKVEAKYDVKANKIQLKYGSNKKVKDYILSSLGQVLFKDNMHFSEQDKRVYKLGSVKQENFAMELDDDLKTEIESAIIVEETIRIPQGDSFAILTLKSRDVELLLGELSNDRYDLKKMERVELTLEMRLVMQSEAKPKTVRVTVSDTSKVSFDPKYTELVNKCLTKWGIYVGNNGNRANS